MNATSALNDAAQPKLPAKPPLLTYTGVINLAFGGSKGYLDKRLQNCIGGDAARTEEEQALRRQKRPLHNRTLWGQLWSHAVS